MTFLPKQDNRELSYPLLNILGKRAVKGDVGIEVEVEGNKFPKQQFDGYDAVDPHLIPKQWVYHRDGSLRGDDNAEYVLKKPIPFGDVPKAVNALWAMFDDYGTVLSDSNRTSVHAHLNVQQFHLNRLCAFMGLYFSVEEILAGWAGEHRVGNMFCLRAKDAPAIISELKRFFVAGGIKMFSSGMHYAALNAEALQKFGSIEVRLLRGCTNPQEIIDWVSVLQRLYDLSADFEDPRRVVEGFSGEGPMAYFERVFGPYSNLVVQGSNMTQNEIRNSLYEGIRFAQDLCYCRDWSLLEYADPALDPFSPTERAKNLFAQMSTSEGIPVVYFAPLPTTDPEEGDEDCPEDYEDYTHQEDCEI